MNSTHGYGVIRTGFGPLRAVSQALSQPQLN